jgi:hypothetical protein
MDVPSNSNSNSVQNEEEDQTEELQPEEVQNSDQHLPTDPEDIVFENDEIKLYIERGNKIYQFSLLSIIIDEYIKLLLLS